MSECDIAIVGGGLSGLCVMRALKKRAPQKRVVLFDAKSPHAGSQNPRALLHPVPGRSLLPGLLQQEAFARARAFMSEHEAFAKNITLSRALPKGKARERFTKDFERARTLWQQSDVSLTLEDESLEIKPAFAFELKRWCAHQSDVLSVARTRVELGRSDERFQLKGENEQVLASQVVLCTGAHLLEQCEGALEHEGGESVLWNDAPASYKGDRAFTRAGAYTLGGESVRLGATHLPPAAKAREAQVVGDELLKKVAAQKSGNFSEVFFGRRAFIRHDRLPLCGRVEAQVFVLSALGGRGLLWAPFLADALVSMILEESNQIDLALFSPQRAGVGLSLAAL